MTDYNWKPFLTQWSRELLSSKYFTDNLQYFEQEDYPPEVIESGWLGYPGATEEQLVALETRLGTTLPPSYREFLKVTSGWRMTGTFIPRIWSIDEVEWFAVRNQELIDSRLAYQAQMLPEDLYQIYGDEENYGYHDFSPSSGEGAEVSIRAELFQTALEVSDREVAGTAIYLLNPRKISPAGEWEAWFDAHWIPGTVVYSSFWKLMQAEYKDLPTSRKI